MNAYVNDTGRSNLSRVIKELDTLISTTESADDPRDALWQLGCYFDPSA